MSRRHIVEPMKLQPHRTVTQVEGVDSHPPAVDHADWFSSQKYPIVRAYITTVFTGGTNPSVDIQVYVRHLDNAATPLYHVARAPDTALYYGVMTIEGNDKQSLDILAEGDDVLVLVEAVNGAPSTWSVNIELSPR